MIFATISMKHTIGWHLARIANELLSAESALSQDDANLLNKKGPELVRKVQRNLARDTDDKVLEGLSDEDKKVLLSYIVYVRENISTQKTDRPNTEDAAKVLHEDVYPSRNKKALKALEKHLLQQLKKTGIQTNKGES